MSILWDIIKILLKLCIGDHKNKPHHKPLLFCKSMNIYHAIIEEGSPMKSDVG
jgi:hypothetical protein